MAATCDDKSGTRAFPSAAQEKQALFDYFTTITGGTRKMADENVAMTTGTWQDCFATPPGPSTESCLARYEADPGYQSAKDTFFNPWKPNAADKAFQIVKGIDGAKYIVVKMGSEFKGIKVSIAMTTGVAALVGLIGLAGAIGFLYFSKEGARYRKKHIPLL